MHNILLVDTLKSSLVMTSEIFKDCLKGCQINIVNSGKECVNFLQHSPNTDMVVVDFNLPDTDGVVLSRYLKRSYKGPVIITAFPDRVVDEAIAKELYAYHDANHWVQKPVRLKLFSSVIEQFLHRNRRLSKRFIYNAAVKCTAAAPTKLNFNGDIKDISMGGMKIHSSELTSQLSTGTSVTVAFALPHQSSSSSSSSSPPPAPISLRVQSQVIWTHPTHETFGVQFTKIKLNDADQLEESLKYLEPIEDTMDYITDELED